MLLAIFSMNMQKTLAVKRYLLPSLIMVIALHHMMIMIAIYEIGGTSLKEASIMFLCKGENSINI